MSTIYASDDAKTRALACARGNYQSALLAGVARWSGSDLKGLAKQYGGRYHESRAALLNRLVRAGLRVQFDVITGPRGGRMKALRVEVA